jgi:hypothetical protein
MISAKLKPVLETPSESWISAIYLVMNLVKLVQSRASRQFKIACYMLQVILMKSKIAFVKTEHSYLPKTEYCYLPIAEITNQDRIIKMIIQQTLLIKYGEP